LLLHTFFQESTNAINLNFVAPMIKLLNQITKGMTRFSFDDFVFEDSFRTKGLYNEEDANAFGPSTNKVAEHKTVTF
jgi:hypothetical protein